MSILLALPSLLGFFYSALVLFIDDIQSSFHSSTKIDCCLASSLLGTATFHRMARSTTNNTPTTLLSPVANIGG
jgi:hypothetical protein